MRKKSTKGRKPILRSLPPIAETCAAFQGYEGDENRSERIFELLAIVIQRHRRAVPLAFYAMRDVADFFEVSLTTVAKVYRRLDRKGALTLVRSSQSMIAPRVPRTRLALRGVVCMPVWLPGFLLFLDWRRCVFQLEEEFSPYRFVAEPIFYKLNEVNPGFVDRLLKYNPDYILWYCPCQADSTIMHSLVDAGVPMVVLQNAPGHYPGKIYHLSHERGLRLGLKEWEASGKIDNIVVPQRTGQSSTIWNLKSTLQTCPLPHHFKVLQTGSSLSDYLLQLAPNPRTAIIFDDDFFYAWLCARVPDVIIEFCTKHRVLVTRQVNISSESLPDLTMDTLLFPWKKVARRIAMDLSKGQGASHAEQPVFEAEWRPRTPLSEVLQYDYRE